MEIGNIIPHIEALIFASEKPLTAMELTELANNAFGFMDEKLTLEQIQTSIDGIVEKYRSEFYPFEVRESGGGLQFLTKKEFHKTVAQLNGEKFLKRLSTAALETLSIVAYKQPVTKGEIEAIRGVSSDYAIQRLLEKELVVITGRNEKMPGHPLVYATSKTFMDYFGINSAEDLPKLKEVFDEAMVNPTIMDNIPGSDSDESSFQDGDNNELLAVTQSGELTTAKLKKDKEDAQRRDISPTSNTGKEVKVEENEAPHVAFDNAGLEIESAVETPDAELDLQNEEDDSAAKEAGTKQNNKRGLEFDPEVSHTDDAIESADDASGDDDFSPENGDGTEDPGAAAEADAEPVTEKSDDLWEGIVETEDDPVEDDIDAGYGTDYQNIVSDEEVESDSERRTDDPKSSGDVTQPGNATQSDDEWPSDDSNEDDLPKPDPGQK